MAATPSSYSKYILLIGLPVLTFASLAALWWKKKGEKKRTYEEMGRVSELFIYPVKSCKGIRVTEAKCFKEGMEFDRHWIILDEKDTFVSQRKDPKLALVVPHFEDDKYLCLNAPKMKTLKLNIVSESGALKRIRVWNTYGEGRYVGDEAAEWISNYLDKPGCKIYQLTKPRIIQEDKEWGDVAQPGDETSPISFVATKEIGDVCTQVSFGEFAPYLITNEASLDALNEELPMPVSMTRFRPNIVVRGLKAWEEDKWIGKNLQIGGAQFRFLKRCDRCILITVNPALGEKDGREPLATLRRIRLPEDRDPRQGRSPLFGVLVALEGSSVGRVVQLGESVAICS